MKKILLISAAILAGTVAHAQPWATPVIDGPVKLEDIIAAYESREAAHQENDNEETYSETGEAVREGKNYHFDRWKWYWERHTDENGYLVSPLFALKEWRTYKSNTAKSAGKTTANLSNWSFAGPDSSKSGYNGIGRINVVAFHPKDTNTIWIGSGGGGAWKTENSGMTWTVINDNFPVLGVSDIEFNPLNPNTIYLCTGDRDATDTYSVGVLKSTDGGTTWDTTGLKWETSSFRLTNDLVINQKDTNSLTLATSTGIYKSYDGGTTWAQTFTGHYKQLISHPTDTAVLYAASFSNSSGTNIIIRSGDGGATWQTVFSRTGTRRIVLAVTRANVSVVKAIVANGSSGLDGIYHSADTGKSFVQIFSDNNCATNILASTPKGDDCGGQGWYDLTLAINPLNENQVVAGGVNTWYSLDAGITWQIASQWTSSLPGVKVVHADKHFHSYHPLKAGRIFECNDGGIYFSDNIPAGIWTDITKGMGITQFYRNAVSNNASFVLGGSQDNGTKKLQNGVYSELTGGDGMDCHIDYSNKDIFYTAIQYGDLRKTVNGGNNFTNISGNIPGDPEGAWITPYLIHPDTPTVLIAGYRNVFYSNNRGSSWTSISPSFPSNIQRLAMSTANPRHIYALVNNDLRITKDYGATWNLVNVPYSGNVTDIQAHPTDSNHLWVTFGGYGTLSNKGRVAQYKDGVWTHVNDGIPNIPVNCIVIDSSDNTLYIGTDFGVFYRTPLMTAWEEYNNKLPNAEIIDLGINYTSGELWAATYGRGMWKSLKNDIDANPSVINKVPLATDVVTVYPNPSYGRFEIKTNNSALQDQNLSVRIMNISGSVVWQNTVHTTAGGIASIDVSALPAGSYMLNVFKDNMIFAKEKIVVYK